MQFLQLNVRTALIVHGFDQDNKEIVEKIDEQVYVTKLIAIGRIQSISKEYLLVTGSHGRIMYWEYENDFEEIKQTLMNEGYLL